MKYAFFILPRRFLACIPSDQVSATVAKGAVRSFVVKAAGMGLVFALQVFLARVLGTEEYGVYVYILSWVNTLLLLAIWGWDTTSVRLVSAYRANGQWRLLKGFLRTSREMVLFSSFVVAGALAASVWYLRDVIGQDLAIVFWIACFILPINAQLQVNEASLRGLQRVVRAQVPQEIVRPVALGVAVLLAFLVIGYRPTAAGAMTLNVVTAAATLCLAWTWMFQATPKSTRNVPMEKKRRDWARIAVPLLLVAGFHALMRRLDILMLGALVGTSEAGIYSVASRIADLASFGLLAANTIMAPIISDLYSQNKLAELQRVLALAAAPVSAITILIALGIVMVGNTGLQIFGQDFTLGYSALAILVVGQTISGLVGPIGFLMTMTGHQNNAAWITGLSATLNGILNFLLIPVYGMEGAAIATTVTMIFRNFVMVWYVWSNLRLSPTVFSIFTLVR